MFNLIILNQPSITPYYHQIQIILILCVDTPYRKKSVAALDKTVIART